MGTSPHLWPFHTANRIPREQQPITDGLTERRVQDGAHMNEGLRRQARVKLVFEQGADVLKAKGAQADVSELGDDVMADMELVRFVSARANGLSDRSQPISEIPRDCDARVWDRYAAIMLCFAAASRLATSSRVAAK